ncbi:MAG: hypothetical protein H7Z38_18255, partial [Rubrivivax sp.]|nr:hypothetical protein [Pyrinomonadaceae bacterium]
TLHAVACAAGPSPCTVAAIPAGRGEVFAQILGVATDGTVNELSSPAHIKPDLLAEEVRNYSRDAKWVGGGALVHRELLRETAGRAGLVWREQTAPEAHAWQRPNAGWSLITPVESYAVEIAKLGLISSEKGMSVNAESLRAIYVRPSDAELKERCRV